ncbi:MAG: hypothetical protein A2Z17_01695 [Gammaproteobacteria bacterium RBG_16_66_13]|nr:MAG: hypothetical protein A2Z17_01695 [Gammaproteobacteria bacterium RBG_16_66_13]
MTTNTTAPQPLPTSFLRAAISARLAWGLIQAMAGPGQDVIIGAVQDPQFGALVMFGSGGIEVEGLGDVAFALAPLTIREAEALIDGTWAGRKLHGVRGQPPADREAVVRAVLAIGQMAIDLPQLAEVEVNPLRVHPEEFGALVMFGSGGIEVEGLGDVAFALAPLTLREAEALIDGTWAGRKLHGVRGQPPADREAVVRAVLAIGQMAIDLPQLAEVEVNPLRVHPEGKGALALDIRMRVHSEQKVNPPALREKP